MPGPPLPKSSRLETKKAQASMIMPSKEDQPEESGEDDHTTFSPSSPDTEKKRSAFEDLTNTSQSQTVQSKKEDDTEHRSHAAKRTSKGADKISLRKSSKVGLVTSLSNVEKQFILDIPTKSKTLTTKEPSVFQKTLVLNKEPATEETRLLKKTLQSRACHQKTFLVEKPLILLDETKDYNEFDAEPMMTSKRKKKPEEADITEKMIDLKMPFIRKLTVTLSPLPLKNKYIIQEEKYTVQGKSSIRKKSLGLKVPATREKSVIGKPFFKKNNPTTEMKSLLQEPFLLQEKCNAQGEASILKKPRVLRENTNNKDDALAEPVTSKRKHSTKEATYTKKLSSFKNNHDTQGKGTREHEPLSYKKSNTKKDSHFQGPSLLPGKCTAHVKVSAVEQSLAVPKPTIEEEVQHIHVAPALKKCWSMEEAPYLKKPSPLKKKQRLSKRRCLFNSPVVQEPVTSEPLSFKKSTTKKKPPFQGPSALQKRHSSPEVLSKSKKLYGPQKQHTKEKSAFKERCIVEEPASTLNPLTSEMQQTFTQGTVFHFLNPRVLLTDILRAGSLRNEPPPFKKGNTALPEKKCTTHVIPLWPAQSERLEKIDETRNFLSQKPGSLRNETITRSQQNPSSSNEKYSIPQKLSPAMPSVSEEKTTSQKGAYSNESSSNEKYSIPQKLSPAMPSVSEEKTTSQKGAYSNESSSNEKYSIPQKLSPAMPSVSEEKTTSQKGAYSNESVTLNDDKELFSPELFSPYSSADENTLKFQKSLNFQEKTDRKNGTHTNLPASQDSVSDEELFLRKLFCKDRYPSSVESSQEKAAALEQEFVLRKVLDESSSGDNNESLSLQPPCFQNYSNTKEEALEEPLNIPEKMALCMESSITQGNSIKEAAIKMHTTDTETQSKKFLPLQETISIEEETLKELIASQEKPRAELVTVLKELLVIVKNPSVEKIALISQGKQLSNVEDLLNEVLELVEKPTAKESTLEEPLVLQENPSTKTEASLKEALALKENPSTEKASCKESLTFDLKADIEKGDETRKTLTVEESTVTLALNEGLTAADQLSFSGLPPLEGTTVIDGEDFSKSFLIFSPETNPNVSSNALASKPDNSSAAMPCVENFGPLMSSSPYDSDSKDSQSTQGIRLPEIIILDDSDSLESIEREDRNPACNSVYIKEIFSYLKKREDKFIVGKYMEWQLELTSTMRAIVVDWMVEVQSSFQMSNETLHLAVKLMDCYLMMAQCKKDNLQFLGSTVYMIAAKFEGSCLPRLQEFLSICEHPYEPRDMTSLEMKILKTLNYDINIPTAYHFLRRYTTCVHASMKTLTLSRFICEITLPEYEFIQEKPSKLAAACLALALYMRNLDNCIPLLEQYTHYKIGELYTLVLKLNSLVAFQPKCCLKNVYAKYSEENFFEVAKIPPLDMNYLEEILQCAL